MTNLIALGQNHRGNKMEFNQDSEFGVAQLKNDGEVRVLDCNIVKYPVPKKEDNRKLYLWDKTSFVSVLFKKCYIISNSTVHEPCLQNNGIGK